MDVRFLCDCNLGKLAKWLRILGYDTLWYPGDSDQSFLRKAGREGRIALTRKKNLGGGAGCFIVVRADRVEGQIGEILEALTLKPDPKNRMTLCLRCNAILEAITREEVEGSVPAYVYQNSTCFRKCPICGRIYWPGTHARNVEELIRMRIPTHPL
ncbi:MAG: Mut7-C RNAse domain-containing protein [Deltaproteobacteria bacterium]|nr:Mut7-C RNAse domain-containing protein [Deltaproteobacteria bacterium]